MCYVIFLFIQRLVKLRIEKYDLHKFISQPRAPKRVDFFEWPHYTFDTRTKENGVEAPIQENIDTHSYAKKLPNFRIDHQLLKC